MTTLKLYKFDHEEYTVTDLQQKALGNGVKLSYTNIYARLGKNQSLKDVLRPLGTQLSTKRNIEVFDTPEEISDFWKAFNKGQH
jgi:hypothetical protein